MEPNATPLKRFEGWFVRSVDKLEEMPEGDGAFAALMVVMPLYERYIVAKLKMDENETSEKKKEDEISKDLQLDDTQRRIFWNIFRDGFMHQGMGKAGKTRWCVSHTYGDFPTFQTINGTQCVCLNPWKFARRVLGKFQEQPELITASNSFPLADVFEMG